MYRFENENGQEGYYNEKGVSARKALLKTPIDGARLSSGYGRRKHPILGYTKLHRGLDFAAPRGTPIYAAGDGVITFAGWKGAYGRLVIVRHNSKFSTAYAHTKSFAKGIKKGLRVRQRQILAYVGSSGRSTGPHLHYEIRKNGKQINPMKIKMPSGEKLTGTQLKHYKNNIKIIDKQYALTKSNPSLSNKNLKPND